MRDDISILELILSNKLGQIRSLEQKNARRLWKNAVKVISRLTDEEFKSYGADLLLCAKNLENKL